MSELEPIKPAEAVQMYLDHRRGSLRPRTIQAQDYRLRQFLKWCEKDGLTNLNTLTGRDLERYRQYRRNVDGVAETTIRSNSYTYRSFLEYCEAIEAVEQGLNAKILIPTLDKDALSRTHDLPAERIEEVLGHLERYAYASRSHVVVALLYHIGCRLGGLRTLDLQDFHNGEDQDEEYTLYMDICHRPDEGTPLKNGTDGERPVTLSEEIVDLVDDYIAVNRNDVTDEFGRDPLITTAQGRISESAIRQVVYRLTRPCAIGLGCPHDRDVDNCEALETGRESLCPSSRAPHDIRSCAITRMLKMDIPPEVVAERVNATQETIDLYYDERSALERMEQRREHLRNI